MIPTLSRCTLRLLRFSMRKLASAGFCAAVLTVGTGAAAQDFLPGAGRAMDSGAVVQTEQVRAELVAHAPDGVDAGNTVWVGLRITHQPHWHTYWKNPGDSGLPTELRWSLPAGISAGDIAWPAPKKIAVGSLANFGYEGTLLLPVPLTISPAFQPPNQARDAEIRLSASWLVCREECVPQEGTFVLPVPLRGSTALHGADFEAAWSLAPKDLGTDAEAQVTAGGMILTVAGLPVAWQGRALDAFPETAELIESAAAPGAQDAVTSATMPAAGTQSWRNGVWSAQVPLSAHRNRNPQTIPWVLALGAQSLRGVAHVSGDWPAADAPAGVSPALQAALTANARAAAGTGIGAWAWALATALLGGLILNLMPCVFPVLAIKVLSFADHNGHGRSTQRLQGLAYTAGVVLSFMALGTLLLILRAGGEQLGWGFQLQSPGIIAVLAILFTLLGLNLAGLLQVGHWLPDRLATLQLRHPAGDAFLSGTLAVAIASPCTATFMGASLGYAITLPTAQALGIFAALGLGLALPFLLASWVPAMGRWLPRPGVWMDDLRRFLAFPMWATVVWLVWVLGHLSGVDGAASLLALLLTLVLLVWSLGLSGRSRRVFAGFAVGLGAVLTVAIGPNVLQIDAAPVASTAATTAPPGSQTWQAWSPAMVETALAAGNPVFVDFTAAWCITCQYNKKTTLANDTVLADFARRHVTLLRADWTRRDPAITRALEQLGRSGVPVYVLYQTGRAPVVLSEILGVGELQAALANL